MMSVVKGRLLGPATSRPASRCAASCSAAVS